MLWRTAPFSLTSLLAAALVGPAAAQPASPAAPVLFRSGLSGGRADPAAQPLPFAWRGAPQRRAGMALGLTDHVDLVANAGKELPQGEGAGRRADGPAGQPRTSRGARLGLLVRW